MTRLGAVVVALGILGLGQSARASVGEAALEAAVIPPEAQVTRGEPPVGGAVVRLKAARGEREPAMVVVRATHDGLLQAKVTGLFSHDGASLPASVMELDRVEFVPHAGREIADRLEPWTAPVPVKRDENLLLWVEVAVPRGAAAGYYHGELTLTSGQATRTLPVELEVLPFSLPQTPSLATSFSLGVHGPVAAFARRGLDERVTFRVVSPPPYTVTPAEGTLKLDFTGFDADLALLLEHGASGPSSIEISVPRGVPMPRRLEYLLAVKRHLTERGCGDLLVNFSEEGSLLHRVQGGTDEFPGVALVSASDERAGGSAGSRFWWRLGGGAGATHKVGALASDADCCLEDSGAWLTPGSSGYKIRSIGWAAFHAGAAGLYAQEELPLIYVAEDGSPRSSLRLKLLRQGLEDYEYLQLASRVDPVRAKHIALEAATSDSAPTSRAVDFDGPRSELIKLIETRRAARTVTRVP
jgi:hypothetical protein